MARSQQQDGRDRSQMIPPGLEGGWQLIVPIVLAGVIALLLGLVLAVIVAYGAGFVVAFVFGLGRIIQAAAVGISVPLGLLISLVAVVVLALGVFEDGVSVIWAGIVYLVGVSAFALGHGVRVWKNHHHEARK